MLATHEVSQIQQHRASLADDQAIGLAVDFDSTLDTDCARTSFSQHTKQFLQQSIHDVVYQMGQFPHEAPVPEAVLQ